MQRTFAIVAVVLLGIAPAAFAEPYGALYLGASIPFNTDLENAPVLIPPIEPRTLVDVELDTSAVFGGKVGYWFENLRFVGVELDIYYRAPDISAQTVQSTLGEQIVLFDTDFEVTTLGLHVMGRYPFQVDDAFPQGRIQLYGGAGVGFFFASLADVDDEQVGLEVLGGFKYFFVKNWAAFGEYKFTDVSGLEFDSVVGPTKLDLTENIFYFGVAYHF